MSLVRCECGWIGDDSVLVGTKEEPTHTSHCPQCKSEEVFYDEELNQDML